MSTARPQVLLVEDDPRMLEMYAEPLPRGWTMGTAGRDRLAAEVTVTEAWLRGPIDGFDAMVMPVVHALVQVREDVRRLEGEVPGEHVWLRPGGAASIGFHIRHTAGALDRLFTYARGETLSAEQRAALRAEEEPGDPAPTLRELADALDAAVEHAFAQLRALDGAQILATRTVGRAQLPSTTLGLLFHAAEHATRHAGQAITTARILAGGGDR